MLSTRDLLRTLRHIQTESEGLEKHILCKWKWKKKKAGVTVLISDKIDFQAKTVTRDLDGHNIMMKGSSQREHIMVINLYAPNLGAPKYIKQINRHKRRN